MNPSPGVDVASRPQQWVRAVPQFPHVLLVSCDPLIKGVCQYLVIFSIQ